MGLQDLFAKSCTDFANCLVLFAVCIITSEEEGAVDVGSFAFAVIPANYNQVERVADAGKIIFLELSVYKLVQRDRVSRHAHL